MMMMMMMAVTSWEEVAGLQAAPRDRDGEIALRSIAPPPPLKSIFVLFTSPVNGQLAPLIC